MKSFYLALGTALVASASFLACTSETPEEFVANQPATTASLITVKDYDASLFPVPDKSNYPNNDGRFALNSLLPKIDKEKCFDMSKLEITEEHYQTIKTFANSLLRNCTSDAEKVKAVYDWARTNIKYGQMPNDPWSVFQNRKGVCHGYANICRVMLFSQHIPSVTVFGWYVNAGAHAWSYAYDGQKWVVFDATNGGYYTMSAPDTYKHLVPETADIDLFEDDNFVYEYSEKNLNVSQVKKATDVLVIPFSINNFRVGMFCPKSSIPTSVRTIYLGSNIKSLGEGVVGLSQNRSFDNMVHVDPTNKFIGSEDGVVYRRNAQRQLTTILYVPTYKPVLKLIPMEVVSKNTIYNCENLEEIVIAEGTTRLEAYAIENCPNLKKVYVPENCELHADAIYQCGDQWEVIRGNTTGIQRIK